MSRRAVGASIAAAVLGLAAVGLWRSRTTSFSYTVPPELVGSAVYLDGRPVGIAGDEVLEFEVSRAIHSLRLERAGQPPVLIQVDLSGHPVSSFVN